ncbi:probable beta-1,4-xylosyltransferase IRX14 [Cynara cardunculus var. scolymus]|uniref:probable beta-1,4-xylosyltransferase IRX14 n=1 Tax=Cynara cardunculus var. scolymus TaxID=59895 RepID=UPI000D62E457|nr:probable beta-1,4-xylosyltransferase IRX14 [Cynara cardunculus var. scolymus]
MKFQVLQQSHANRGRSNSCRGASPLDSSADGSGGTTKSAAAIFWIMLHCLCCLISLVLGFRFSRLVFFLLFSSSSTNNLYTSTLTAPFAADIAETLSFTTSLRNFSPPLKTDAVTSSSNSRVVVGRHGIRIRSWPHPNPEEVMKAHRIMQTVQREQRVQYGIKNPRTLIVVTPTYVRTFQALHLTGLMHTLTNLPYEVVWIVVEAGGATNETAALLANSKLQIKHIGYGKKMPIFWDARHKLESQMRLQALRVVREEKLDGIVMFADDSNMHSLELFDEIQKVQWIGALSVGILAYSSHSDEDPFEAPKNLNELDEKKSPLPIQGPACNSSDQLIGWHTFNSIAYRQKSANYIGDMAIVLPRKLEWCGFVMNSRLVWEESEFRPEWIKDLDMVATGNGEIENPLSFLKDSSMVEPLGSCGKKVMLWWLRAEARADSKFPAGWRIEPQLEVTVAAKRTPWPDAPPELPSKVILENGQKNATKTQTQRSRRSSRGKRKHERLSARISRERTEK